jgi:hypothetical protein
LELLRLELDQRPALPEFAVGKVQLEGPEAPYVPLLAVGVHDGSTAQFIIQQLR